MSKLNYRIFFRTNGGPLWCMQVPRGVEVTKHYVALSAVIFKWHPSINNWYLL